MTWCDCGDEYGHDMFTLGVRFDECVGRLTAAYRHRRVLHDNCRDPLVLGFAVEQVTRLRREVDQLDSAEQRAGEPLYDARAGLLKSHTHALSAIYNQLGLELPDLV